MKTKLLTVAFTYPSLQGHIALLSTSPHTGLPSHCLAFSSHPRAFAQLFLPPAVLLCAPMSRSQLKCHPQRSLATALSPPGSSLLCLSWCLVPLFCGSAMMYYYLCACMLSDVCLPPRQLLGQGHLYVCTLLGTGLAHSRCSINHCWIPERMLWLTPEPSLSNTLRECWASGIQVPGQSKETPGHWDKRSNNHHRTSAFCGTLNAKFPHNFLTPEHRMEQPSQPWHWHLGPASRM